jgi:DNA-nicking Smr family endonuclease
MDIATAPDSLAARATGGTAGPASARSPERRRGAQNGQVKLKLDLHDIYNRSADIDRALTDIIAQAVAKRATLVEIIPGKGSGALKKRVLRFLAQKEIRALYHRVEKDSDNFGRLFVHFRWTGRDRAR